MQLLGAAGRVRIRVRVIRIVEPETGPLGTAPPVSLFFSRFHRLRNDHQIPPKRKESLSGIIAELARSEAKPGAAGRVRKRDREIRTAEPETGVVHPEPGPVFPFPGIIPVRHPSFIQRLGDDQQFSIGDLGSPETNRHAGNLWKGLSGIKL